MTENSSPALTRLLFATVALVVATPAIAMLAANSPEQSDRLSNSFDLQAEEALGLKGLGRFSLSDAEVARASADGLLPSNTKSLLKITQKLRHGDFVWDDVGVPDGQLVIWVDLRRQMISVYRDGHEIGTSVIVYGVDDKVTPIGTFSISRRYRDYKSRTYNDAPMPYSQFITNDGVALHGSPMSARRATHGCVGLPVAFAKLLFGASKKGDPVHIVRSQISADEAAADTGSVLDRPV